MAIMAIFSGCWQVTGSYKMAQPMSCWGLGWDSTRVPCFTVPVSSPTLQSDCSMTMICWCIYSYGENRFARDRGLVNCDLHLLHQISQVPLEHCTIPHFSVWTATHFTKMFQKNRDFLGWHCEPRGSVDTQHLLCMASWSKCDKLKCQRVWWQAMMITYVTGWGMKLKQCLCLLSFLSLPYAFSSRPYHLPKMKFHVLIIRRVNAWKTLILQRICNMTESPKVYRITNSCHEEVGSHNWVFPTNQ